jgi:hypothetical protein
MSSADDKRSLIFEPHFTAKQLAEHWGYAENTVFGWFRDEPGVLRSGDPSVRRRTRVAIRIPQSVAERVYRQKVVK